MRLRRSCYKRGSYTNAPSLPKPCPSDAPDFLKDYCDFYHTKRGYHPRSVNSGLGWNATTMLSHLTFSLFDYADEIESAVLLVHGDKALSYYASERVFKLLKGSNKEFLTVKNATHCDLYDGGKNKDLIPFDKIDEFLKKYLN
ncbi:MAG: alpha/beta hydrolase [Synergistaceae bacterium]|nr:alpha/beta hydrolase [Synergistaceae bacterium]MBQ9581872.1 alpha/beta hydrolase [Synergistaceae bacterium]MBR0043322.1 alpha/beta hydrolase [Synergistaceae bacterium]MBR0097143.1 alpha/beta hydrolase [Synergistaceae bacterium]